MKIVTHMFAEAKRRCGLSLCLLLVSCAGCSAPKEDAAQGYDLLVVNGLVYDGSRSSARRANIGVRNGRIASINALADADASRVIDASDYVVTPGFIDPHTHALVDLLSDAKNANANYLTQGVTTVFVGSDGGGVPDLNLTVDRMTTQGIGSNAAFFAGHGEIRTRVMGLVNRAPTDDELEQMLVLVEDQMKAGAIGLSTGLYYIPGSFSATEEVVALAKVAARFDGVYDTHMRDESSYSIGLLASVQEVIAIAEGAKIAVHISHLKALGRDVWGQSGDIIAMVDAARERGLKVTANQYPYRASGTRFSLTLVPAWVRADSNSRMFERLENADLKDRIRAEMEENLVRRGGAEAMLVTGTDSQWQGMTLAEIAEKLQYDELDAAIEVVRNGDPSIASFVMNVQDITAIAIQEWVMTGSDGSAGHPRKYASYPKAYQDMVVTEDLFPFQQFIHRSSGLVADTFGLCDRGYLKEGRQADIVILDLQNYQPVANFENPTALATGVVHAFVNGVAVVRNGELTGALPGIVIDRQNLGCRK